MEKTMTPYELNQMCSGIKIGDKVKVVSIAEGFERGWNNVWSDHMTGMLGNTYTVNRIMSYGIFMEDQPYYAFPFFSLEKVED